VKTNSILADVEGVLGMGVEGVLGMGVEGVLGMGAGTPFTGVRSEPPTPFAASAFSGVISENISFLASFI
jgi:hypothetical protein